MKNVNMTINSSSIQAVSPPVSAPFVPSQPGVMPELKKVYNVSFSVQFDEEAEALSFAAGLLNTVTGDED